MLKPLSPSELDTLAASGRVLFFLDYDGTLATIRKNPDRGRLPARRKKTLQKLARLPGVTVALISGRTLASLKKMLPSSRILYAGNHGFELEGLGEKRIHPAAVAARETLKRIARGLLKDYRALPGILMENKVYTLCVHYGALCPADVFRAKAILMRQIRREHAERQMTVCEGKKVWEIHPAAECNKGTTVLWLFARIFAAQPGHILPVYIGDDLPDEPAFRALGNRGYTIRVTGNPKERSKAAYALSSINKVFGFLEAFIRRRKIFTPFSAVHTPTANTAGSKGQRR
jgi:trehalose-phosphatase